MTSETLTIEILENIDISESNRTETAVSLKQTEQEIRTVLSNRNNPANFSICETLQANQSSGPNENGK